ncbi:hypothetical protein NM688_g4553 [Phlebia brevispora]|uniref:Uncharacterized protein n=1 Tax=Phlebia brevispora TaxID=194682 RepID=A0ACC1T383_9APHY|nr:hypothetical protein NM688_g4553 [Phlebia brevispora]
MRIIMGLGTADYWLHADLQADPQASLQAMMMTWYSTNIECVQYAPNSFAAQQELCRDPSPPLDLLRESRQTSTRSMHQDSHDRIKTVSPFSSLTMPKVILKYSVIAMNKETSLLECITPSKDIHVKWFNITEPEVLTCHPAPSLIDCIAPRNEYVPPAPPAKELKFHKTKILVRIKEFELMLEATKTQLDLFFAKLRNEDSREDLGLSFDILAEVRDEL